MRSALLICFFQITSVIFPLGIDVLAHEGHAVPAPASIQPRVRAKLVDAPVVTHLGRRTTLAALAGERVVVIDFAYTSCTTFCPVVSAIMDRVGRSLENRVGSEIVLMTVTVDPVRDTPQRLAAYAARFAPGGEWHWVTGEKSDIDAVLKGLGAYTANPEDHPPLVLVGHPASGKWTRLNGLPDAEVVAQHARNLADLTFARGAKGDKR